MAIRTVILLVVGTILLSGCQSGPPDASPAVPANAGAGGDQGPGTPVRTDDGVIPDALNRVRAAAQHVALLPPVGDPATRREIELQAMLYRAVHETNAGEFTRHFLLEPVRGLPMPRLTVGDAEIRLRVLARLVDLGVPIAWGEAMSGNPVARETFPGTRELATRLRIKILERSDDSTRIRGELEDWTVSVASSRQWFTATWSDGSWLLERDRARLVW